MVGRTTIHWAWSLRLHYLCNVGGLSGKPLFLWPLHLSVLFSGTFWRFSAQLVWPSPGVVACVSAVFSGASDPVGARWISRNVLSLSRKLLQGIMGRSAVLLAG